VTVSTTANEVVHEITAGPFWCSAALSGLQGKRSTMRASCSRASRSAISDR
jgi:hypothetical protein